MKRKTWNIAEFDKINLPEVIGSVDSLISEFNGIRVLDMPIFMPGQGWQIPTELNQFVEAVGLAAASEKRFGDFQKDHYVYITVDQKVVWSGHTGRRGGAHSDAYIEVKNQQIDLTSEHVNDIANESGEVSHTYIVYDSLPTEFFNARFPLNNMSCDGSLKTFDQIANSAEVVTYPAYTMLRLDPYVVHRCSICDVTRPRTFVKISISRKKYARVGNTINPMFKYNWEMGVRSPDTRNHPWS